ncbi:hypothetical protein EAM_1072 [Erwinia amylovora ATCC 49946]|nr:hypothetical protein EAM_1072 [Erwinia amylovora ATCC 49946]
MHHNTIAVFLPKETKFEGDKVLPLWIRHMISSPVTFSSSGEVVMTVNSCGRRNEQHWL